MKHISYVIRVYNRKIPYGVKVTDVSDEREAITEILIDKKCVVLFLENEFPKSVAIYG
jgi:hypothetical protein